MVGRAGSPQAIMATGAGRPHDAPERGWLSYSSADSAGVGLSLCADGLYTYGQLGDLKHVIYCRQVDAQYELRLNKPVLKPHSD